MELLIVRHAIAFERDGRRWPDDGARPLSPKGIRRARGAAAGLKEFSEAPVRLLTSPLLRASQTAQILTEFAGWPQPEEVPELLPGGAAQAVWTLLGKAQNKLVAVVGHQPDLGALLADCLVGDSGTLTIEMKKNAVACVAFKGSPRAGGGTLRWLATPRMLRGFRHR